MKGKEAGNITVALNILLCAVMLSPWARRRETVCGFVGRHVSSNGIKGRVARKAAPWLERTFHKDESCVEVFEKEEQARKILYG